MGSYQQDIAMNEISNVNFDYHKIVKNNNLPSGATHAGTHQNVTRSFVVANRTDINKILYTSEDAPDMVLINVPPILRPNSQSGTLYFTFELTYMIERVLLREPAAPAESAGNKQGVHRCGGGERHTLR